LQKILTTKTPRIQKLKALCLGVMVVEKGWNWETQLDGQAIPRAASPRTDTTTSSDL